MEEIVPIVSMTVDEFGDWLVDKGFSVDVVDAFAG